MNWREIKTRQDKLSARAGQDREDLLREIAIALWEIALQLQQAEAQRKLELRGKD